MRNFERLVWIVLVALFATLAFKKQPVVTLAAPPKAAIDATLVQRFVPILGVVGLANGMFALDTKSGKLCRTWDWQSKLWDKAELPVCSGLIELDLYNQGHRGAQ